MKFHVQLVIERDNGTPDVAEEIAVFQRGELRAETLGITLAEAKELLRGLQQAVVTGQTAEFAEEQTHCPSCDAAARGKASTTSCFGLPSGN